MRELSIDFAPRSLRRTLYRTGPFMWLLACIGIALCVSAALSAEKLLHQIDANQTTLLRLKGQLTARDARKPAVTASTISEAQAAAVNRAIAQLNLPWRDVFDAVESATPKTIALLSLEPDARRNVVKGMAEASNSDEMIAYVEQLKKQDFFTSVLLTHHEINQQDPNKPVRFQFEAQWRADAP